MDFMQSVSVCFSKYITFKGRAQRAEFWWFVLFIVIGNAVMGALDSSIFGKSIFFLAGQEFSYNAGFFGNIFALLTFLPMWGVQVRRLHDIGKSGWWLLLCLIPLIGFIILLIWMIRQGETAENQYGPNPLA